MHNLRWDDLQYLLAVAEHGSLSGAARQLGVNHATVLRRIDGLERVYGVRLFDRPPGGYRLRPEAQDLLGSLRAIGRNAERVQRTLRMQRGDVAGRVRVTTTDSLADLLLPRYLKALGAAYPLLRVDLAVANHALDLGRPEAELTLRPARNLPEGLEGVAAADMRFGVYGSADYLARHGGLDMDRHRWLGATEPLTRSPVGTWQEEHLSDLPVISADSFLTLGRMAAQGLGLAMLPCFVGALTPGLVRVPGVEDGLSTRIWVAAHPDLLRLERVRTLAGFFADALAGDAALLLGEEEP